MSIRKTYFGAGPAVLPQEVLTEAANAVKSYLNTGLSILELPHRGKYFDAILEEANALVRELCGIGEAYDVLWLQGGGRHQFAMVPMNFLGDNDTAAYVDSGHWSHEAIEAASSYGNVSIVASSREDKYNHLPAWPLSLPADTSYVHFTTNNTIYGTQWPNVPECSVPLVTDMSSDIFCTTRNYNNCNLFYAVAQKNLGIAGVTLVVIRKDMYTHCKRELPDVFSYEAQAKANSVLNTPPVFAVYVSLLMLRWLKAKGLDAVEQENKAKAELLYNTIDASPYFYSKVSKNDRSLMNVVFLAENAAIEKDLLSIAQQENIEGIAGHRSTGGFRASIYNATTLADVQKLATIIQNYQPK